MSLNSLLESANPYHSVQNDAARLAGKWEKTGLLEGLDGTHKNNMGIILENQAKQLVVENSNNGGGAGAGTFQSQTGVNTGGQWAGVALPLVRKVFGQIAAKEFVSVQPMNLPSGLVFFLDFQYGTNKTPFTAGDSLYGDGSAATAPFGNEATGGLYGSGRFGYSTANTQSIMQVIVASASWSDLDYNSDYSASAAKGEIKAFIAFYENDKNEEIAYLTMIAVCKACWHLGYGKNYIRNQGVMNPADGVLAGTATINGTGNAFPMMGTGNIVAGQVGLLLPKNILGEKNGQLQPYVMVLHGNFDRLQQGMFQYDAGLNWYISGYI